MNELKNCPHCGGDDLIETPNAHADYHNPDSIIKCMNCGAESEKHIWNRRATTECPKVEWRDVDNSNGDACRAYINNMSVVLAIKGNCAWIGMGYFCGPNWTCEGNLEEVKTKSEKYIKDIWNKIHNGDAK